MDDKPRLLIIAPSWSRRFWGGRRVLGPPLVLPLLAGLTPPDVDVRLIDENVESVDLNAPADWVALTCMTASAPRAYEIADAFRNRGIPVVMGGIHPSVMPEEAGEHADTVVIGEAEPTWPTVLEDLAAGRLKPRYAASDWADMTGMPLPRRDLLRADCYISVNGVQTARGCPHNCSFCSVTPVFGRRYRFRPIPEVIEEVRTLKGWIGFVDDNLVGHPRRAKELFEALIPLKISWVGQADLSLAWNPEMLALAVRSGCQAMFIGLESLSPENLRATGKTPNLRGDMGEAIDTIHRAGIEIIGSFVLGLDGDDLGVFRRTVEFAEKHKLMAAQFAVLTPYPGTAIREQLEREGRIEDSNWARYTMSNVVFRPKQMTAAQLAEGQAAVYKRFYSIPSILKRTLDFRGRSMGRLLVNLSYRGVVRGTGVCKVVGSLWGRGRMRKQAADRTRPSRQAVGAVDPLSAPRRS
jgi:radical SAM superfamily enzyme YgiQ (UPF0313 family)